MSRLLDNPKAQGILESLQASNELFMKRYPGDSPARQPVHTVYGGAHLFKSDSVVKLGQLAERSLKDYAPDFLTFATVLGLAGAQHFPADAPRQQAILSAYGANPEAARSQYPEAWIAYLVYQRVCKKVQTEAVEDFRIDFEDGFGNRPDEEEDAVAIQAAQEVAKGMQAGTLPPYIGIRIKTLSEELKRRSLRTLDLFVTTLSEATGGKLPDNFVVTLPKVTHCEQVEALVACFGILESETALSSGSLKMEIMVETPQSILAPNGEVHLPRLVDAAEGRCIAAHFGTYDYTASVNITAAYQVMDHPACDYARNAMKVSLAQTGVWLSDGATNVMPVGPHRATPEKPLTPEQEAENRKAVYTAWKTAYDHTRHSLKNAMYQGWDLHPAQFPVRYAACYSFFLEGLDAASERLKNFIEKAAQATLVGNVFDDAATGQGLLNYFLRALNCGAVTEAEVLSTGLSLEEVRSRSFVKILEGRRKQTATAL